MEKFPMRLRVLRAERNITQQKVASDAGMSFKGYNNLESGKSVPSASTLILLADYYDVSLDYLIGRSENRSRN